MDDDTEDWSDSVESALSQVQRLDERIAALMLASEDLRELATRIRATCGESNELSAALDAQIEMAQDAVTFAAHVQLSVLKLIDALDSNQPPLRTH